MTSSGHPSLTVSVRPETNFRCPEDVICITSIFFVMSRYLLKLSEQASVEATSISGILLIETSDLV